MRVAHFGQSLPFYLKGHAPRQTEELANTNHCTNGVYGICVTRYIPSLQHCSCGSTSILSQSRHTIKKASYEVQHNYKLFEELARLLVVIAFNIPLDSLLVHIYRSIRILLT